MKLSFVLSALISSAAALNAAPLPGWKHTGVLTVLTTPEGANLSAGAVVEQFPLLVRLDRDGFDFSQAKPDGADVRFTTSDGTLLPHQIEEWDASGGKASIWVRVPRIEGNTRLPLNLHWGKTDASSASDGKAVFSEVYLGVWHMDGVLAPGETRTQSAPGVIGTARHFNGEGGIKVGDNLTGYPTGHEAHTTELWFRTERAGSSMFGWGNSQPQGKVVFQLRGPPHIRMDCWFSEASIHGDEVLRLGEWQHAAFVYEKGSARLYIDGAPAGSSTRPGTPMKISSPASLWMGGWFNEEGFCGDMDEVRISKVNRSAEWIRLQYENQKPLQTLVGPLMRAVSDFAVTPEKAVLDENGRASFKAQAGGAEKIYWSLVREGREQLLAVDRFAFEFDAGRVTGDQSLTLRFKAVRADGVKTRDIPITVRETMPDPDFTLEAPSNWDGRTPMEIRTHLSNKVKAGDVRMEWQAGPGAVTKDVLSDRLRLLAAQKNGPLTVTATLSNGGASVSRSMTILVTQPAKHTWIEREPEEDEKPEECHFYSRNDRNEATLHYRGVLAQKATEVFLRVFADDRPFAEVKTKPDAQGRYAFAATLKAGLVKYRVEFGTRDGGVETVIDRVGDLVCGDVFLLDGQSNTEALDLKEERPKPRETNEWLRTYGGPMGRDDGVAWLRQNWTGKGRPNLWSRAVWAPKEPEFRTFIGWWGMELGKRLIASEKVPVCIINGALGGTRIDQHQRNVADPADMSTIYGRWLWRLRQARLTHGVRAVIWHQGENDQPADNPLGRPGHEIYAPLFLEMAAGWQRDLPNARRYFMFQIWPNSCAMGGDKGAGDRLREAQRTLPELFDNLSILSTLGIRPPGGCHYPKEGYNEFARMLHPLIGRDLYGRDPSVPFTPPNLKRVSFANAEKDALTLEFDQGVVWLDSLATQFYLDGEPDRIASGSAKGNTLTLKLKSPATEKKITYLQEKKWSQDTLLVGENGLAALTFCDATISLSNNASSQIPKP
jgi:hypothetical protein